MMAEGMRDCGSSQRGVLIVLPWMRPSPPIHRPLSGLANLATLAAAMAIRVLQAPFERERLAGPGEQAVGDERSRALLLQ